MAAGRRSDATCISERLTRFIVDVLRFFLLIIEVVRPISHERIQQRILEENLDVPEADQGQSPFEREPSVSGADTSCTGAWVVADSEQSALENNPADYKDDVTWTTTAGDLAVAVHLQGCCGVPVARLKQVPKIQTAPELDQLVEVAVVIQSFCSHHSKLWLKQERCHRLSTLTRSSMCRLDCDDKS